MAFLMKYIKENNIFMKYNGTFLKNINKNINFTRHNGKYSCYDTYKGLCLFLSKI